jgi:hypothetical protein
MRSLVVGKRISDSVRNWQRCATARSCKGAAEAVEFDGKGLRNGVRA